MVRDNGRRTSLADVSRLCTLAAGVLAWLVTGSSLRAEPVVDALDPNPLPNCFADIGGEMATLTMPLLYGQSKDDQLPVELQFPKAYLADLVFLPRDGSPVSDTKLFTLRLTDGQPYPKEEAIQRPLKERLDLNLLLSSRGAWVSLEGDLGPMKIYVEPDQSDQLRYELGDGPYDLKQFKYIVEDEAGNIRISEEKKDFFVRFDDSNNMRSFLICSKPEHFPNPQCDHRFKFAGFTIKLSYRRNLLRDWQHFEALATRFVSCASPDFVGKFQ